MKLILGLFVCLISFSVFARVDVELSRAGSETNFSNILSVGYSLNTYVDAETEEVGLNHYFGYVYSDGLSVSSLNANLSDFEILAKSHELSYSMTFSEALTVNFSGGFSDYNQAEARSEFLGLGLYYQFEKIQIGYGYSENFYKQIKKVTILAQDITDRIRFKQKMHMLYLDYQWTETLLLKLTAATYSYQTYGNVSDLDSFSNTATGVVFLAAAGPSMAEQSLSQIKSSLDLGFLYNFSENWLLDTGLQSFVDQLTPNTRTNAVSLAVVYANTFSSFDYTLTGSLTSLKTENVEGNSFSGLLGLSFSF